MEENDILQLALSNAVEAAKKLEDKKEFDEIGLHPLYEDSVEMAEHIRYHAVKGVFPKELFKHRSPNQTEAESTYIEKNYKQHTLPIYVDYRSTITRPFGDGNWSIEYKEDDSVYKTAGKSFQKYVEEELPIYGSLENFIKFILPDIKSIDANGFISVRPKDIPLKEIEGEIVIDSDELYEPTIFYHASESVINFKHNLFYLFLTKEKSVIKVANQKKKEGLVFELYTKNSVYFIVQKGEKSKYQFDVQEFYTHNIGEIPVKQLMGIPNLKNNEILWQSPFLYATDLLDVVATNANWLQASINSCVFPVKVMYGQRCEFRDSDGVLCQNGKLINGEGIERNCTSCNGSGLKSRLSPVGTLLINPSNKFETGEEKATQAPLQYISPEVHTLEFLRDKIAEDEAKARKILHLQTSNSNVKGSENMTATGMAIDNKSMYAFVKPISDQMFMMYEFCLKFIGLERYKDAFEQPDLSYPKTFDFKSSEDYLQDISKAIENNLPPSFIQAVLMNYLNAYYGDSSDAMRTFKLIASVDRLWGMTSEDINNKLARGLVAKWEDILHNSVILFITEAINEDAEFLNKELEYQKEYLINKAKEVESEIAVKPVDDLINSIVP